MELTQPGAGLQPAAAPGTNMDAPTTRPLAGANLVNSTGSKPRGSSARAKSDHAIL
ncbi:MAG: hypothetical protein AAF669_08295 [Pseudomonadota bacterium]